MKTLFYLPLLYGKEYLETSLKAVKPFVNKIVILYTHEGSYGHRVNIPCPETEQELKDIAFSVSSDIAWKTGDWFGEGEHRNAIWGHASNHDLILTADSDEVFHPDDIETMLKQAYDGNYKRYGVSGFINLWKSFNSQVNDSYRPVRVMNINATNDQQGEVNARVYHFGYCQSIDIQKFKWLLHGHRNELRQDWIEKIYLSDETKNVHPVANGVWNVEPFDKNTMPEILKQHPNFTKYSCL